MAELVRLQQGSGRFFSLKVLRKHKGVPALKQELTLQHTLHRVGIVLGWALVCLLVGWLVPVTVFAGSQPDPPSKSATSTSSPEEVPSWIHPSPYTYESKGKQDPFLPFIRKVAEVSLAPSPEKPLRARTPLELVEVTELKLEGILWNPANPESAFAMVALPDGKGFILRKGMTVGRRRGIITEIAHDRVIVEERYVTLFGEEKDRLVPLKLYSEDGKK